MTLSVSYILGTILILVCCVSYGLWMSNRRHDEGVDFTVTCSCGGEDFEEGQVYYICKDCGTKQIK